MSLNHGAQNSCSERICVRHCEPSIQLCQRAFQSISRCTTYPFAMDIHHRKIDLQSSSDLTYLLNNIKVAAQEKLDLAIPKAAAPEGEDAYRSKVEELVQEVVELSHRTRPSDEVFMLIAIVVHTPDSLPRPTQPHSQWSRSVAHAPPQRPRTTVQCECRR